MGIMSNFNLKSLSQVIVLCAFSITESAIGAEILSSARHPYITDRTVFSKETTLLTSDLCKKDYKKVLVTDDALAVTNVSHSFNWSMAVPPGIRGQIQPWQMIGFSVSIPNARYFESTNSLDRASSYSLGDSFAAKHPDGVCYNSKTIIQRGSSYPASGNWSLINFPYQVNGGPPYTYEDLIWSEEFATSNFHNQKAIVGAQIDYYILDDYRDNTEKYKLEISYLNDNGQWVPVKSIPLRKGMGVSGSKFIVSEDEKYNLYWNHSASINNVEVPNGSLVKTSIQALRGSRQNGEKWPISLNKFKTKTELCVPDLAGQGACL